MLIYKAFTLINFDHFQSKDNYIKILTFDFFQKYFVTE